MKFEHRQNGVTICLEPSESFILARRMLKGFRLFDTRWLPPFPLGSPFFRLFYGSYFAMRQVSATADCLSIPVRGPYSRGNFFALRLEAGQRYCVGGHSIAGFSGTIKSLHTRIKFQLPYWLVMRHFFPVFEGPGEILLYSKSAFEESTALEFESERIVAFDIDRVFQPSAPEPKGLSSRIHNVLFSREVVWQFLSEGVTIAELHSYAEGEDGDESFLWRWLKHLVGLFRF